MRQLWSLTCFAALFITLARAQELADDTVDKVRERLAEAAKQSWEIGTHTEALLEHDAADFSVFSDNDLPPSTSYSTTYDPGMDDVLDIASAVVANRSTSNNGVQGPQPLMADGSAADPVSIGIAVLLANWTGRDDYRYERAAEQQLQYILQEVPRTDDGAISHRVSQVQLWSDFVYMVPPFLAYYGVLTHNTTLIDEAYNQIKLYRQYLKDNNGLWKHVVLGNDFQDVGHWSTGNGWAAAGMLRVLATMKHSQYSNTYGDEMSDLGDWVKEIHDAMYPIMDKTSVFRNYPDYDKSFYDASGTALLASSVYRTALLTGDTSNVIYAEWSRKSLVNDKNGHFDDDGWLQPVVNPHSFGNEGEKSAEGQAFVLLMQAGWSEWQSQGSPGNGASALHGGPAMLLAFAVAFVLLL